MAFLIAGLGDLGDDNLILVARAFLAVTAHVLGIADTKDILEGVASREIGSLLTQMAEVAVDVDKLLSKAVQNGTFDIVVRGALLSSNHAAASKTG